MNKDDLTGFDAWFGGKDWRDDIPHVITVRVDPGFWESWRSFAPPQSAKGASTCICDLVKPGYCPVCYGEGDGDDAI